MWKLNSAALLLAMAVGLQFSPGQTFQGTDIEKCSLRANQLPPLFSPKNYRLTLEPDLTTFKFRGSVDILATYTGDCGSRRHHWKDIILKTVQKGVTCGQSDHSKTRFLLNVGKKLEVDDIQVSTVSADQSKKKIDVDSVCMDPDTQLMEINLKRKLKPKNMVSITIKYKGQIGQESRGFYQSLDVVQKKPLATTTNANTHFFPADARSTFPNFDQPDMKASFELTLTHDKDLVSISNSEVGEEKLDDATQKKTVRFKETPKMSTYVFAFAVGHYEKISCTARNERKTKVTAYAPPGRAEEAMFVLDTACKAIPIAERYFGSQFPLEKLDLVVTRQQRDPVRENWGMLVFTEDFMLTDEDTTNVLRVEIAKLVTHNVLHHWFGDLVTARWWDDQWIFDGFTLWRSHLLAAEIYPKFDYDFNYLLRTQSVMLDAHASPSVHAIKTYQDLTADQELALFDENTYNKAATLYHTIHDFLSEGLFRKCLAHFVKANAYGSGDADRFFEAIRTETNVDMGELIRTWLDQPGAPLVTVELSKGKLIVKQERLGVKSSSPAKESRWTIPIKVASRDGREHLTVIDQTINIIDTTDWPKHESSDQWVKVNPGMASFYRVKYSPDLLKRFRGGIKDGTISPQDRYSIIDDLRALYNLGHVQIETLRETLEWYDNEMDGGVLSGLAVAVQNLALKVEDWDQWLTPLVHRLFDQVFKKWNFEVLQDERHKEMNGRQDALAMLVRFDHQDAIDEALARFDFSDVHLTPFLRKPVYLAVVRRGSDSQKEQLVRRLAATKSDYERQILLAGLKGLLGPREESLLTFLPKNFDSVARR